jgi:hypothetical protein
MDISNEATAERIRRLNRETPEEVYGTDHGAALLLADADRAALAGTVADDVPYDFGLDE